MLYIVTAQFSYVITLFTVILSLDFSRILYATFAIFRNLRWIICCVILMVHNFCMFTVLIWVKNDTGIQPPDDKYDNISNVF